MEWKTLYLERAGTLYLERAGFEGSNADVHVCSFIQGANWPDPFPDYTGALFSTVDDDEWGTLMNISLTSLYILKKYSTLVIYSSSYTSGGIVQ